MSIFVCNGPNLNNDGVKSPQSERAEFKSAIENTWARGWKGVHIDLPRLAKRTIIHRGGDCLFDQGKFGEKQLTAWESVLEILKILVNEFENENKDVLLKIIESYREAEGGDISMCCQSLISELAENHCSESIVGILQSFNQSLVYRPSSEIIERCFDKQLLKDVREKDGWIVEIRLKSNKKTIQVIHRKKQQSIQGGNDHVEVQWDLSMTFPRNVSMMHDVNLQLVDLKLAKGMDVSKKQFWNSKLCAGRLKVL